MVKISEDTADSSYTIDLITDKITGEIYVSLTAANWDDAGDCIGFHIEQMAGPLYYEDVEAIRRNPDNWDPDPNITDIDVFHDNTRYRWEQV